MFLVFYLKSPHTPQGLAYHTSGNTAICTKRTVSAFSKYAVKSKSDSSEMITRDHSLASPRMLPQHIGQGLTHTQGPWGREEYFSL